MRTKLLLPSLVCSIASTFCACGGGGGGDGGTNPTGGTTLSEPELFRGSWTIATSFLADDPLAGSCAADALGTLAAEFVFCEPCEHGPDGCGDTCDAYLVTSPSVARGALGAAYFPAPASDTLQLLFGGTYYDAGRDLSVDLSFGFPEDYGFLTESGWEASVSCALYAGDVLVPDLADPQNLVVDPEALPLCEGKLGLVAVRTSALSAAVEGPARCTTLVGRFVPSEGEARPMRLEREPAGVRVIVSDLVVAAPTDADGRFHALLLDGADSVEIEGLLQGEELALGRLELVRGGARVQGRFTLRAR